MTSKIDLDSELDSIYHDLKIPFSTTVRIVYHLCEEKLEYLNPGKPKDWYTKTAIHVTRTYFMNAINDHKDLNTAEFIKEADSKTFIDQLAMQN